MKKITQILFLFIALFAIDLNAKPIDVQTAESVALNFIRLKTNSPELKSFNHLILAHTEASKAIQPASSTLPLAYYYVFNIGDKGFIIVSADDRVIPVTAYSEEKNFTTIDMPTHVAKWLESYKSQIRDAIQFNYLATESIENEWKNLINGSSSASNSAKRGSVSPLVAAKWNQGNYYNASCPYDNANSQRTVTGCVATAMAQVMKYWNYPSKGTGSHSYNHSTYGTLSANFGATTYNWSSMPNNVNSTNSSVATLMYQIGVSVDMNYNIGSKGGSGAFVINSASPVTHCTEYALKTYFGYKTSLSGIKRSNYSSSQWLNLMKAELDASRPIVYAGFGNGGGHCFVADGYDNNNFLHFNWGWGGAYDGYFSIDALNPGGVGTGGGTGGYNNNHQAVIGIQPENGGAGSALDMRLYANVVVNPTPIEYSGAFTVTTNVANFGTTAQQNFAGDFTAAIFNSENQFVSFVETLSGYSLNFNSYFVNPLVFTSSGIGAMTPGDYTVGIYYKPTGATQWISISEGNYANFIPVEVEGNEVNDLKLYAAIQTNPTVLIQDKSFTVTFDIANFGANTFNGDVSVDIHKSDGTWIKELDVKTGLSLPTMTHFTNGLTYTITDGLDLEPGTYQFFIWDKPTGGSWEFLGSGNFSNPINVQLIAPGIDPDMYEVNNVINQSYNLPMTFQGNTAKRTTIGSNCHNGADYDYYKVVLPAGFNYNISARLHDAYSSSNGMAYTLDALVSYSTDGTNWSDAFDDIIPGLQVSGANTVYFLVSPYFTGATGTYLFDVNISRSMNTSTDEINAQNAFKMYPNPANDFINIEYNGEGNSSVQVINALGQVIIDESITRQQHQVSTAKLNPGVYIVQLKTNQGTFNQTIVIQ